MPISVAAASAAAAEAASTVTASAMPKDRLRRPRLLVASASSRGGNEPWAQLLTGALATYAAHHLLTGEDIRPTNRGYRP